MQFRFAASLLQYVNIPRLLSSASLTDGLRSSSRPPCTHWRMLEHSTARLDAGCQTSWHRYLFDPRARGIPMVLQIMRIAARACVCHHAARKADWGSRLRSAAIFRFRIAPRPGTDQSDAGTESAKNGYLALETFTRPLKCRCCRRYTKGLLSSVGLLIASAWQVAACRVAACWTARRPKRARHPPSDAIRPWPSGGVLRLRDRLQSSLRER